MPGTVTCPQCHHQQTMEIPKNQCLPMYRCQSCKNIIMAKQECCVFCEYGDSRCPVSTKK